MDKEEVDKELVTIEYGARSRAYDKAAEISPWPAMVLNFM